MKFLKRGTKDCELEKAYCYSHAASDALHIAHDLPTTPSAAAWLAAASLSTRCEVAELIRSDGSAAGTQA
jgi:hypothetical protein